MAMGIIQDIHDDLEKGAAQLVAEYRNRLCRDAFPEGEPDLEERLMEAFDAELVRDAIQKLSAEQREAIILHYVGELQLT